MKILPIKSLKKKLWEEFSLYIRTRDFLKGCISCGKKCSWGTGDWQAGHYYTMGSSYANVAFDEQNVNGQCSRCNKWLEGNKQGYRNGLISRYGPDVIEKLDIKKSFRNVWTRFEYEAMIRYYKEKNKKMEIGTIKEWAK